MRDLYDSPTVPIDVQREDTPRAPLAVPVPARWRLTPKRIAVGVAGVLAVTVLAVGIGASSSDEVPEAQAPLVATSMAAPTSSATPSAPMPLVQPVPLPATTQAASVAPRPRVAVTTTRARSTAPAGSASGSATGGGSSGATRTTTTTAQAAVYYANCSAAKQAGAAPLYRGQAGYRPALDSDDDGVACES